MPTVSRRGLFGELGALAAVSWFAGCKRRDRPAILAALVREVVGGMAHDLFVETQGLQAAIRALDQAPAPDRVVAAQRCWKRTALAWKRAFAFRSGPFASSNAFARATFWPARPTAIAAALLAPGPIDERRIEGLGVEARGLFALEYLLFDPDLGSRLGRSREPADARARSYARELVANVLGYAQRITRLLGDGRAYGASFASAGQASVNQLVAQSIDSLDMVIGKFDRVARAAARNEPRAFAAEGYFSGTSLEIAGALIAGTKQLYLGGAGGGLSDLVASASPAIDQHLRALFTQVETSLRALGKPLELGVDAHPVAFAAAADAVRNLMHIQKVEMVSALEA